ncbi:transposase domain-containing protein [Rhizobium leguminosarum]|uniref:transposase domain-containing protein n=1 Tax=Rhizobium leguminosarum TaxID=384 RepID=UPI0036DE4BE7
MTFRDRRSREQRDASLIETCKLKAIDPLPYLTAIPDAINGHDRSQIDKLLPSNCSVLRSKCHR